MKPAREEPGAAGTKPPSPPSIESFSRASSARLPRPVPLPNAWPISLCLLCRDEARNLEGFFQRVRPLVREIVVIDSGSTDESVEIASRHADILVLHAMEDFSAQRNLVTAKALNRWVFHLDADEVLTPELIAAMNGLFESGRIDEAAAYCFPRKTFDERGMLRKIVESYPGFHYRLYDRERCRWTRPVHETLDIDGPKKFIPHHILHYPDYGRVPQKVQLYVALQSRPALHSHASSSWRTRIANFLFHARALFFGLGMWKRPADFLFAVHWLTHQALVRLRRRH